MAIWPLIAVLPPTPRPRHSSRGAWRLVRLAISDGHMYCA
jgi:hypothetical protein